MLVAALGVLAATAPELRAADGAAISRPQPNPSCIVIGFVGGFVRHDNPHQKPVQIARDIQRDVPKDAYVQVFENRHRRTAYETILRALDRNHDGTLSDDEKSRARIVLFGHSWGASAVVLLARELNRVGIPVLLTVQVDSVAKLWQSDGVIPQNVAAAVNFYQTHGLVHGRPQIVAADASKTQILGNYRVDYTKTPVKCETASWFDRLTPSHAQSECDPHLWAQVEDLVRQRMEPQPGTVAVIPQP
jgi:pimeloyl-ACP methyl ester carboxylesterase